ncbi:cation diffusion facilitator family transporter [Paenibacillus caui]|uniref:cation diffusion facilitator family transporter n=1 Tax=Paenibacillus caui TaxID=2873927 RepID=UPI001CA9E9AE|nr:cation transporter [Paenibacillus caui]
MTNRHSAQWDEASWIGIINNLTFAVFRGAVGWLAGSIALLSDALLAVSEAAGAAADKLTFWPGKFKSTAKSAASKQYEGKIVLVIGFSLFLLLGIVETVIASLKELSGQNIVAPDYVAGIAAVLSIGLQEAAFQVRLRHTQPFTSDRRRLIKDHWQAMLASFIVLIGVVGALTGRALDEEVLLYLDPLAAITVSMLVLWKMAEMLFRSLAALPAERNEQHDEAKLLDTVQRVYGVITVDQLLVEERGFNVQVYVIISVNPRISIQEAGEIAGRAKVLLLNRFSYITAVEVRAQPYDPGYPYKSNCEKNDQDEPTLLQ